MALGWLTFSELAWQLFTESQQREFVLAATEDESEEPNATEGIMSIMRSDCLYSTVKNVSGGTKKFTFLPPHGRELAAGEEFTVIGDIVEAVIRGERVTSQRNLNALEEAVRGDNPTLDIIKTPNPIIYDPINNYSKMLVVEGGVLGYNDPCWDSESEAGDGP